MIDTLKKNLYSALTKHFEAKREKAIYQLNLAFQKSVSVGEHPKIVEDAIVLTEEIATADEAIDALQSYFGDMND